LKPFFVYMLRCADKSYYVGHTDELDRRVAQHQSGAIEGYTFKRRPVELVWTHEAATREDALTAELRIKGWGRSKKEALIRGDWTAIQRHAWGTRNPLPGHLDEARASIPQPERGGGLAADTRKTEAPPVRPEVSKGPQELDEASIPQPERAAGLVADTRKTEVPPVRLEVSKGLQELDEASIPQPERVGGLAAADTRKTEAPPVRPEVSKGLQELDEASTPQPERGGGLAADTRKTEAPPVRPEVSKGLQELDEASIPQPERGQEQYEASVLQPELGVGDSLSEPDRALFNGVLASNRRAIAKAITLLESTRADHRQRADALLNALIPHTGNAMRLGISGVPGVGKSTFIEVLGLDLIAKGHRVAVLTIDPSSTVSGGSILGDKTRMEKLSVHDAAYIRPSPASGTLGGVAEKTREAMLVCEAAGYDVVIIETVGVGQSETAVASMTDMFVLLQLPNAGDDLQAIKKGVMELADLVVINKADIDPDAATRAEAAITSALRVFSFHGKSGHWSPKVMQISALKNQGIDAFWQQVRQFHERRRASGEFDTRRNKQAHSWMWDIIHARLQSDFRHHPAVREALHNTLRDVTEARIAPSVAARALLDLFERE